MTTDFPVTPEADNERPEASVKPATDLVCRPTQPPTPTQPWRRVLADWRVRLPELARSPAVRTAATLGAGFGFGLVADVLRRSAPGGDGGADIDRPTSESIRYVVEPAVLVRHVVHHHVVQHHHVVEHAIRNMPGVALQRVYPS